jgi:membrane-anchored glycerophosphoryl diester phosphodiesterase (GDPDase)
MVKNGALLLLRDQATIITSSFSETLDLTHVNNIFFIMYMIQLKPVAQTCFNYDILQDRLNPFITNG